MLPMGCSPTMTGFGKNTKANLFLGDMELLYWPTLRSRILYWQSRLPPPNLSPFLPRGKAYVIVRWLSQPSSYFLFVPFLHGSLPIPSHIGISLNEVLTCVILFWCLLLGRSSLVHTVNSVVLKLHRVLESPGGFVKTQMAGPPT